MSSHFVKQAHRLLRENWEDAATLAEEIYSVWRSAPDTDQATKAAAPSEQKLGDIVSNLQIGDSGAPVVLAERDEGYGIPFTWDSSFTYSPPTYQQAPSRPDGSLLDAIPGVVLYGSDDSYVIDGRPLGMDSSVSLPMSVRQLPQLAGFGEPLLPGTWVLADKVVVGVDGKGNPIHDYYINQPPLVTECLLGQVTGHSGGDVCQVDVYPRGLAHGQNKKQLEVRLIQQAPHGADRKPLIGSWVTVFRTPSGISESTDAFTYDCNLAPFPPMAECLPGRVLGRGGQDTYTVCVYPEGLDGAEKIVEVRQLQMSEDKEAEIPSGTWTLVAKVPTQADGKIVYKHYMQVPVWL